MKALSWGIGRLILWACLAVFAAGSAHAEKRIALVIANEAYTAPNLGRLPGTKVDAQRIASALVRAGFPAPRVVTDVNRDALRAAVRNFVRQLAEAGPDAVGFFYYSGHGIADSRRGQNYLIPIDANITTAAELPLAAEPLDEALDAIEGAGVRAVFVVIDACRSTPTSMTRGSKGLLPTRGRTDTLVAFATAPGETAADDGLYSRVLAEELVRPGANSVTLFAQVQQAVARATGRRQIPQFLSSLVDPVQFVPVAYQPPVTAPVVTTTTTAATADAYARAQLAECDRLTKQPAFNAISPALAIPACTRAVTATPGSQAAQLGLGLAYHKAGNYVEAKRWYEFAVATGNSTAMNNLAVLYENSLGVTRDYATAKRLYERAAGLGNVTAMRGLGALYNLGRGVPIDYVTARGWYEKAAAKGDAASMYNLGLLYDKGNGVTQDYVAARRWYEQAAAKGDHPAMNNLGVLYGSGRGVPKDYTIARQWYEKAAANGSPLAMKNLGQYYQFGYGVVIDLAAARRWYEKAASLGNADAKDLLAKLPK